MHLLKPPEKTRWQVVIDRTLTMLLVALTIEFFAVMWQRSEPIDALDEYRYKNERDFLRLESFLRDSVIKDDWTFTSNAFWGEKPEGTWILTLHEVNPYFDFPN
jgi:hypothetical protein